MEGWDSSGPPVVSFLVSTPRSWFSTSGWALTQQAFAGMWFVPGARQGSSPSSASPFCRGDRPPRGLCSDVQQGPHRAWSHVATRLSRGITRGAGVAGGNMPRGAEAGVEGAERHPQQHWPPGARAATSVPTPLMQAPGPHPSPARHRALFSSSSETEVDKRSLSSN